MQLTPMLVPIILISAQDASLYNATATFFRSEWALSLSTFGVLATYIFKPCHIFCSVELTFVNPKVNLKVNRKFQSESSNVFNT